MKVLENIIDKAFGVETEPRKVLTLKRKPENDSANVIAGLITQVKGNEEQQEPTPSFNNCCISKVALYSAKHRNHAKILESGEKMAIA
ncbi:transcriptional antitermination N peptide [Photorhabdus khanii]